MAIKTERENLILQTCCWQ